MALLFNKLAEDIADIGEEQDNWQNANIYRTQ
jgi:hypothetical protein